MRTTALLKHILLILVTEFFACSAWPQQAVPAPLAITTESLPRAVPHEEYRTTLQATGGVPPYHWSIAAGTLPAGLRLDLESGMISGTPTETGDFHFTVGVTDSAEPPHTATRELSLAAAAALSIEWSKYPRVDADQISGAVNVANGTKDEFDQTVIILAVNEIGKAFALGYQHFKLKPDSGKVEITFGSSLPRGTYVVHADAVAEVALKHAIYRDRLQTPQPLVVSFP
ncbi:MAG TPA: Ig domain-containing protein [Terriglobales bacterium]|nr:Ig domain-containing protein [Terriglobales bacterium]